MKERGPVINTMPDRETLESFMRGVGGERVQVVFNTEKGEFEWLGERPQQQEEVSQEKPDTP